MTTAQFQQFPHQKYYAWFNHALVAPPTQAAREAVASLSQAMLERGPWMDDYCDAIVRDARAAVGKLVGAKPAEICLTKSTTQGIQIVANSLRWREGANIVALEGDFPANRHSWRFAAEEEGVKVRLVRPDPTGRYSVDDILACVDGMTQLVAVSWVHYATGFRLDIKKLCNACRERHVLTFVDGIQGVGAIPIDVKECAIDFLASASHKWMLGPEGCGFLYVRDGLAERLMNRRMAGWLGAEDPFDFDDPDPAFSREARRFEDGSRNMMGLAAMTASIYVLRAARLGAETLPVSSDSTGSVQDSIFHSILKNTSKIVEGLRSIGMEVCSPMADSSERSGIVSFRHPNLDAETIRQRLANHRVFCSCRGGRLRASPHFYTTDDEIERLLSELDMAAG